MHAWYRSTIYGVHEFFYTLMTFPRAWRFMVNHRLWEGLRQYGWVARALVVIGILVGLAMIGEVIDWLDDHADASLYTLAVGEDSLVVDLLTEAYESLSDGVLNWVILVLLEVVVYHFMRRTLRVILGKDVEEAHKFKPFLQAQQRMIKISFIAVVVQEVSLGISEEVLPAAIDWVFALSLQSVLLGYAIADNYNEQFELTTGQSWRYLWRNYIGICIGLGLPLYCMLQVPLVGTLLGPLVTSVVAAIVLREKSDLHLVGYRMNEKERRKAAKKAERAARKKARKEGKKVTHA